MKRTRQHYQVLQWLIERGQRFTSKQMATGAGVSNACASDWVRELVQLGWLDDLEPNKTRYKHYRVINREAITAQLDHDKACESKQRPSRATDNRPTFKVTFFDFRAGARFKVVLKVQALDYQAALSQVKVRYPDALLEGASVVEL